MPATPAVIPIILGISAALGAVSAGVSLADRPKSPAAPTAAQTQLEQAQAAEAAAQAQALALQKRRGLASTILTSPMGVTGGTTTQRATLGA